MCDACAQPLNSFGLWFRPIVARPAKRNQVFQIIGPRNRPRDNVVNIQLAPDSGHFGLVLSASLAGVTAYLTRFLSNVLPFRPPFVVLRCATLPIGARTASHSTIARRDIAMVRAKLPLLIFKSAELLAASFATFRLRLFTAPSCAVIASHAAKFRVIRPVQVDTARLSAPLACDVHLGKWLAFPTGHTRVPRGATICEDAISGAVFSSIPTDKRLAALCAGVMNWFVHVRNITGTCFRIKHFDIAVKRIRDAYAQPDMFVAPPAPAPVQGGMGF